MIWPPHYDRYSVYQIQEKKMGVCVREKKNTRRLLAGKPEGKSPL